MLNIQNIGGWCPVQAEGTVGGKPFYFRARGNQWSMAIGGDPIETPGWFREDEYGASPDAGYMPLDEARAFIEICAADYLAGKPGKT